MQRIKSSPWDIYLWWRERGHSIEMEDYLGSKGERGRRQGKERDKVGKIEMGGGMLVGEA